MEYFVPALVVLVFWFLVIRRRYRIDPWI